MIVKFKNISKTGVTRKIVVLLFVSGIIPLLILAGVFFTFYFKGQKQGVIDIQREIGDRIATSISAYLEKTSGQIQLFASTLNLEVSDEQDLKFLSDALMDQVIEFDAITIADPGGNEVSKVSRFYTFRSFELEKITPKKSFQIARAGKSHIA